MASWDARVRIIYPHSHFDTPRFLKYDTNMKVLLVHNYWRETGGEERYVSNLADLLRDSGHDVLIWTKNNRDIEKMSFLQKTGVVLGMFWNWKVFGDFSKTIEKFRPDVVHFNNIFPLISPTAYWACKRKGIPIVQTIHNYRFMFPKSILFRRGEMCELCLNKKFILPAIFHPCNDWPFLYTVFYSLSHMFHTILNSWGLVDLYIFPSKFTRSYYIRNSNIPGRKTMLIFNFVKSPKNSRKNKNRNGFLFVGRLVKEKGIIELLEAIKKSNHKLTVIGKGPLLKLVKSYEKYPNISIKGYLPSRDILRYMRKTRATIIASKWLEVQPMVVIESFASGTPVIAPKIGGLKEMISEGETGFFYRMGDWSGLLNILNKMEKQKKNLKMAGKCELEYKNKYSSSIFEDKIIDAYKKAILTSKK